MTAMTDPPLCSTEGCSTVSTETPSDPVPRRAVLTLAVVSDTICPWCYVGKRRIERAVEMLAAEGVAVTIRWLPFELNSSMAAGGMDRRAYRSAKFGSWEQSQKLDAQVAAEGAREGIVFRHDLITRTPNTRASHRLIWLAGEVGDAALQSRLVEALFSAYFCEGRDIGDRDVLAELGAGAGLDATRVEALLAGSEGADEVLRLERWASAAGIRGVPSVLADDRVLFSGALRTPLIVRALRELMPGAGAPDTRSTAAGEADARS